MKEAEKTIPWVAMPIQMFNYDSPDLFILKEDDDAFKVYFELAKFSQNPWTYGMTSTTVTTLGEQIPFVADKTKNRARHRHLLTVLTERGYIDISPNEYKNDTLITIKVPNAANTIQKEDKVDAGKKFKFNRFVQVNQEDYEACLGNARYFRAWIYAEHRMFRGEKNEGEWVFHNDEWQNVMGIQSRTTIVKLFDEMQSLNIIDKIEGKTYKDKNGNVKSEGSKYIPVSKGLRAVRQEQVESEDTGIISVKNMNIELDLATDRFDEIDPRAEQTNLHNSGWLTPECWFVWYTTEYEATKKRGDKRFGALKDKNYNKYKEIEGEGKKLLAKYNSEKIAKKRVEEMSNIQYSPEEIAFQNRDYIYVKKSNGGVDISEYLD